MNKILLYVLTAILLCTGISFAETKRSSIEITAGAFSPDGDYDDYGGWENGNDMTVSYIAKINDFFAVETGLHAYNTEMESGWGYYDSLFGFSEVDGEVTSLGFNILGRVYHQFNSGFRVYGAAGLGLYFNEIEQSVLGIRYEDDGRGLGVILKAGVDYVFTNGFYLGVNIKTFANSQEIEFYDGTKEDVDLGGTSYGVTVGYSF
jgi:outer membrane protein W